MNPFRQYLAAAMSGQPLTADEMANAIDVILCGNASDIEIAGFLAALRARGETVEEIVAAAKAMNDKALRVDAPENAIDTAGTGGDGANTFNISTAAALIIAGCGVPVAKHGNRAASSKSGSSEVLEALGVRIDIEPAHITRCIEEAGIGFMFAPLHHRAAGQAGAARKALGVRTMFNVLGPLANPARAKRQLIGVFTPDLLRPIAEVLRDLGATDAWVVHGADGLDEITTTDVTHVAQLRGGEVSEFTISPEDAGLGRSSLAELKGGDPDQNANALRAMLEGQSGAYRTIAVLNAAGALMVSKKSDSLHRCARLAEKAIDDGAALAALDRLITISNGSP